MMNLFANSSSNWVKYDKYEWKKADNGTLYITPTEDAKPSLYNPVKEYQDMVLAAINIGTLAMKEEPKESLQASIIDFACNYGLLHMKQYIYQRTILSGKKVLAQKSTCPTFFLLIILIL